MPQTLESDRRQRTRDGILEALGDITFSVLRKHGVDGSARTAASEAEVVATATT